VFESRVNVLLLEDIVAVYEVTLHAIRMFCFAPGNTFSKSVAVSELRYVTDHKEIKENRVTYDHLFHSHR
jgi:hypothetical protein